MIEIEKKAHNFALNDMRYGDYDVPKSPVEIAEEAYIAGAKENGIVWHKVADGEYPKKECGCASIDVLNDRQELCYFHFKYGWCELNANEIDPPIAWCEIPQFKGE